jgi:maleylacetoacetate isomerase
MSDLTLYHYWRSSSSWRVRFALELKKLKPTLVAISLLDGQSESAEHRARNPLGYVPVLHKAGRPYMIESMAIIEWLDETYPSPRLFPGDSFDRQHVRALCEIINSSTQPFQNPNVTERHSSDKHEQIAWAQFFIRRGLEAFETLATPRAGRFAFGDAVTAADLFLVPQCYAAERFHIDVDREFPRVAAWNRAAAATPECQASHPDRYKP